MPLRAVRVNESRSRLNATLRGYLNAEWWYAVEHDLGGDPREWPGDVVEGLLLAVMTFRQAVGRIDVVARTYACVPDDGGRPHCVLQITYARVAERSKESLPSSAEKPAGGSDGPARGLDPRVDAAAPARPFSASLCGND